MNGNRNSNATEVNYGSAPRITAAHIESIIAEEIYFTPADAIKGKGGQVADNSPVNLLTICVLVLKNNFTVTGESACASPENFNAEIGRKIARDNAISKVWMLEGYLLKESLSTPALMVDASNLTEEAWKDIEEGGSGDYVLIQKGDQCSQCATGGTKAESKKVDLFDHWLSVMSVKVRAVLEDVENCIGSDYFETLDSWKKKALVDARSMLAVLRVRVNQAMDESEKERKVAEADALLAKADELAGLTPDYAQRMVEELKEVEARHQKLCLFMQSEKFGELHQGQKFLLRRQSDAMREYISSLVARISMEQNIAQSGSAGDSLSLHQASCWK